MVKKIKSKKALGDESKDSSSPFAKARVPKKDLEKVKADLEKAGEAVGDLFKGLFKGVGKILDIVQEMEQKGEQVRTYKKELKGVTKSGKEFRGEAGWRIKTGLLKALPRKKQEESN